MALSCRGGNLQGYSIPEFHLDAGQVVSLIWPGTIDDKLGAALSKMLTAETNRLMIRSTHIYFTRSKMPWSGITGHCNGTSFKVTDDLMTRFGEYEGCYKAADPMRYAGNQRAIIGLELAFKKADIVIFDAGATEHWPVYRAVSRHLAAGKSAIEISEPIISRAFPWPMTHPDAALQFVSPPPGTEAVDDGLKDEVVHVISDMLSGKLTREEAEAWGVENLDNHNGWNDRCVWLAINALGGASFKQQDDTWLHSDQVYEETLSALRTSSRYGGPLPNRISRR